MAHDLQMLLRPEDERTRICTASKAEVAYPVAFLLQMTMYNMEERCRSTRIYSFILTVLFDMYSTLQFHRPLSLSLSLSLSHCSSPQSGQLSGYSLASRLSLVVVAFADQIWTPTELLRQSRFQLRLCTASSHP